MLSVMIPFGNIFGDKLGETFGHTGHNLEIGRVYFFYPQLSLPF